MTSFAFHDHLLLFFLIASAYFFHGFAGDWEDGRADWRKLFAAAALLGLAVLTKYNGVFLGLGYAVWVLARPKLRPLLKTPQLWLAALARHRHPGAGDLLEFDRGHGELPLPPRRTPQRQLGRPAALPGARFRRHHDRPDVAGAVFQPVPPALAETRDAGRRPRTRPCDGDLSSPRPSPGPASPPTSMSTSTGTSSPTPPSPPSPTA